MSASVGAQIEGIEKIAAADVASTKEEVELTEAKKRLVKAESELDVVKAVLRKAEEAVPIDAQRVAKAELGVAKAELGVTEAKLGVAEAKLGVAEAKWQAASEGEKAVFLESVKTAQAILKTAQGCVETANMAYKKALSATATQQQGESSQPNEHCQPLSTEFAPVGGHSSWFMWFARPVLGTVSLHFVAPLFIFWCRALFVKGLSFLCCACHFYVSRTFFACHYVVHASWHLCAQCLNTSLGFVCGAVCCLCTSSSEAISLC